jgi:hypothetical protein
VTSSAEISVVDQIIIIIIIIMACRHKMQALLAAAVVAGLLYMLALLNGAEASVSHCQQQTTVAGNKLIDTHKLHTNEFLFVGLICQDE